MFQTIPEKVPSRDDLIGPGVRPSLVRIKDPFPRLSDDWQSSDRLFLQPYEGSPFTTFRSCGTNNRPTEALSVNQLLDKLINSGTTRHGCPHLPIVFPVRLRAREPFLRGNRSRTGKVESSEKADLGRFLSARARHRVRGWARSVCRLPKVGSMFGLEYRMRRSDQAAPVNAPIVPWLDTRHSRRRVTEQRRW